jgi:hypothetical protein
MSKRTAALASTRQTRKKRLAEAASSVRAAPVARVQMCAQRRIDRWEAVAPVAALKKDGWAVLAFAGPQIKANGHTHVSRVEVDRVSSDIIELSKRGDMFGLFQSLKQRLAALLHRARAQQSAQGVHTQVSRSNWQRLLQRFTTAAGRSPIGRRPRAACREGHRAGAAGRAHLKAFRQRCLMLCIPCRVEAHENMKPSQTRCVCAPAALQCTRGGAALP